MKTITFTAIVLLFGIISSLLIVSWLSSEQTEDFKDNHFEMVKLGIYPNTKSREPTEKDLFTNVLIKDGDTTYALYESRDLSKLDYGKTFVVPVE